MLQLDSSRFTFENGLWRCNADCGSEVVQIDLKGDDHFFDLEENAGALNDFASKLSTMAEKSSQFAKASEYAEDIEQEGNLTLESVYIDSWTDIQLWYSLGDSEDRMLAVQWNGDIPVSVYCDHP